MKQSAIAMLLALMLLFSACAAPSAKTGEIAYDATPATPEWTSAPVGTPLSTPSVQPLPMQYSSDDDASDVVFELEDKTMQIFALTASPDGSLYYSTTANEIRMLDAEGKHTLVNDGHINYTQLCWGNDRLLALVRENGNTLLELDENGNELKAHDLGDLNDSIFADMVAVDGGKRIVLTRGNIMGMGVMGYLYDLETEELTPLKNDNEATGMGLFPLANGEMFLTRMDFTGNQYAPLQVTIEKNRPIFAAADFMTESAEEIFYNADTGKYYTTDGHSPESIALALLDRQTGAQTTLSYLSGRSISAYAFSGAYLYYRNEDFNAIRRVDLAEREAYAKRSGVVELHIGLSDQTSLYINTPLKVFAESYMLKHPEVKVSFRQFTHDWENGVNTDVQIAMALLSGQAELDVVAYDFNYRHYLTQTGLLKDLRQFPALQAFLENPNLLDGVRNVCENADGFFAGIPFEVEYFNDFYALDPELFARHNIPLPALGDSYEDVYAVGRQYLQAAKSTGRNDVYFFMEDRTNAATAEVFPVNPTFMLNAANQFTPSYDSQAYLDHLTDALNPQHHAFNLRNDRATLDEKLLFPRSGRLYLRDYFDRDMREVIPGDALEHYYFWAAKKQIPGIFEGTVVEGQMLGVAETSQHAELAASFLAEFFDETYQRENAKCSLLYKDIASYRHLSAFPESFEACTSYMYQNYVEFYAIPGLWGYMNADLYPLYASGEITLEEVGQLLQKEALKRLKG